MKISELIGRTSYEAAEPKKGRKEARKEAQLRAKLQLAGYCPKQAGKAWNHNPKDRGRAGKGPDKPDRPGRGKDRQQI